MALVYEQAARPLACSRAIELTTLSLEVWQLPFYSLLPPLTFLSLLLVPTRPLAVPMSKQFLRCCELLDEVFKYFGTRRDFDGDPQSKANWHADLLNAALVCRDYREPALDILWSHMDDLRPLFLVLGTFRSKRMTMKKNKVVEPCPIMVITSVLSC